MPRIIITVFAMVGMLAMAASCGEDSGDDSSGRDSQPTDTSPSPGDNALAGRTLVVTGATEAGKKRQPVAKSQIRLEFTGKDVHITAGCNTMNGSYELEGDQLTVGPLASTEMACAEPVMDQELWIAELFENPVTLGTDPVTLTGGDVVLTLGDRKDVSPDAQLTGTTWRLDTIGDGQGVSTAPKGKPATITFDEKGNIAMKSFCNSGGGTVNVGDGTMEIGAIMTTQMACTDAERGKAESAMKKILYGEVDFEIEENTLTITNGDQSLGFSAD